MKSCNSHTREYNIALEKHEGRTGLVYIIIYAHFFSSDAVVKNPPAMQETQETWV